MTLAEKHRNHSSHHNNNNHMNHVCSKHKSKWNSNNMTTSNNKQYTHNVKCPKHHSSHPVRKSESVISTDSDIRFTRRKLGDSQKCGCFVIAAFLIALLLAGAGIYLGYTYLRPDPLPERVFRAKFRVTQGDQWTMDLADQNSLRFQHKARDYRERINLVIRRSDLKDAYEGSEVLALDGTDETSDVLVHFNLHFDPYRGLVSTADLLAIFGEEITAKQPKYFENITVDPTSLIITEVTGLIEEPPETASSPLGVPDDDGSLVSTTQPPPRRCEPLRLNYCKSIGYNITTYPNLLGHYTFEEVVADVIAFRELVDGECFRQAFDFVCRLLQPPCEFYAPLEPTVGRICREYCQLFVQGCGGRLPLKFKQFFNCEYFPESTGTQSCQQKPQCTEDLQQNAQSPRLCDGIADCPDLSDEKTCNFCPPNSLYCGRGRACVPQSARCDGRIDCPDGADEKDCLSIAPMVSLLDNPQPLTPYFSKFYSKGFAVFSEKGSIGKLCSEGLEKESDSLIRQTVADSLCRSLSYASVRSAYVRNDTEPISNYVKVLDPHAAEISFVRTACRHRKALFVECGNLQCGIQSVASYGISLSKMAAPGDWPWFVALFREGKHVCDGTLISENWVLTTESCFQGQPKATWLAIFGVVRLTSHAPWTQRRRIIGLVKSPVEGSTAALIRLETPVAYSDFVRPICLPDELTRNSHISSADYLESHPQAEELKISSENLRSNFMTAEKRKPAIKEVTEYFAFPILETSDDDHHQMNSGEHSEKLESGGSPSYVELMPQAEPLKSIQIYPLPEITPQTQYYAQLPTNATAQSLPIAYITSTIADQIWTNCNTLGWSKQRDHLQRVQLKIGDMAACENVSIATVNSMCTEATFHKQDCTEEEFAGSPVLCLITDTNKWALVGVASWRIGCGPTGVERPRMYDKITSNSAWIRDTINAI